MNMIVHIPGVSDAPTNTSSKTKNKKRKNGFNASNKGLFVYKRVKTEGHVDPIRDP